MLKPVQSVWTRRSAACGFPSPCGRGRGGRRLTTVRDLAHGLAWSFVLLGSDESASSAGRRRAGLRSVSSPSPRPSPLGRGRTVRCACPDPERLDSSPRGMRCSLALRERARVRGKATQLTKTAGGIRQAQFDRLPVTCVKSAELARLAARCEGGEERLGVHFRLRAIRRDAEWCDRDGRAPRIESSVARVEVLALQRCRAATAQ